MQHIIARTSKAHHLIAPDWHVNGAGHKGIPAGLLLKLIIPNCCFFFVVVWRKRIIT